MSLFFCHPLEARRLLSVNMVGAVATPLAFEPNVGQSDANVDFLTRGTGYGLFLTDGGQATLSLRGGNAKVDQAARAAVLRMRPLGANPDATASGERRLPGRANFFVGDRADWRSDIPTFAAVRYDEVYRGVDLVYYGTDQRHLEYDFVVAPNGDPGAIRLAFDGADRVELTRGGDLVLHAGDSSVTVATPVSYQTIDGARVAVDSSYVLDGAGNVRFHLGAYDASQPLVIDPVISYATYLGGTGFDAGYAIAIDSAGSAYVTGRTATSDFPTTPGAFQTTDLEANNIAFVTKFTPDGTGVAYSTYLGGGLFSHTHGFGIAVDSQGNAYVTGETLSTNFPVTPGAYTTEPYDWDAFVTKLNPTGSALVWSSRIGGEFADYARDIAIDAQGNAYITGETYNWGGSARLYPTTPGSFQPTSGSHLMAFVTKINADGASLAYSSFHGGITSGDTESGWGIAVDPTGAAYITGDTTSLDYPLVNPFDTTLGGARDAYVAKVNPAGSALVYSTYLGGTFSDVGGRDFGRAIEVDATGHAYVTGWTDTFDLDFTTQDDGFPTTPNAFQPDAAGRVSGGGGEMFEDAFVTKFSPAGNTLVYSTYLGGAFHEGQGTNGYDNAWDIAVDNQGYAYIAGHSNSTDFPIHRPLAGQGSYHDGLDDGFITKLGPDGSSLAFSSFIGTGNFDEAWGVAVDGAGNAYVVGLTTSDNFPVTPGAYQPNNAGGVEHHDDAFVMKVSQTGESRVGLREITATPDTVPAGQPAQITVRLMAPAPAGGITVALRSARTDVATIPSSAFFPEGQTTVTFPTLTTQLPPQWNSSVGVIFIATLDGAVRYEGLTVTPAPLNAAATQFNVDGSGGPAVRITFNKDVDSSTISASDLRLIDAVTGQNTGITPASVSFDGVARAATWQFSGALPDGRYRAVLPAGSVTAQSGETLAADVTVNFHALGGDANRDRRVNLDDFNILAANFGQSNRVFTQGDFTYDGRVNLDDFNILAARFGASLPAGASSVVGDGDDQEHETDDLSDLLA